MNTDNYSKYERMYDILLDYEQKIHLKNQKRIRIGLKCLIIIPLIFLAMLFWTGSSKNDLSGTLDRVAVYPCGVSGLCRIQ